MTSRIILFAFLIFSTTFLKAQTDTAFNSFAKNQTNLMVTAYQQKDGASFNNALQIFLTKYTALSKDDKDSYKIYYYTSFYNFCCTYCLLKNKAKALEYLGKSINAGYSDYAHLKIDTDLDFIRNDEKFKEIIQPLRATGDYLYILKKGKQYDLNDKRILPAFTYESSNNSVLVSLRKKYNLDSIAGFGNKTSRVINLLHWVHNTVHHDGEHESGIKNINAAAIINAAETNHIGVSCGELATTLNECYLAMGFASRKIYCFPKDSLNNDYDSHVINVVFLPSKNKWVWMDPTNDAYVMDENGDVLSIEEVRQRLIDNKPLIVNPDANWNHKMSVVKEDYLERYMAKNLYRLYSPLNSEYDYETFGRNKNVIYVDLLPLDYNKNVPFKTNDYYNTDLKTTFNNYYTYNPDLFWQAPTNN